MNKTLLFLLASAITTKVYSQDPAVAPMISSDNNMIISQVAFSNNGDFMLVNSKAYISLIESGTSLTAASVDANGKLLCAIALSPDGKIAATGDTEGKIILYDIWAQKSTVKYKEHKSVIVAIAFTPDGSKVVSAATDRSVQIWSAASGKKIVSIDNFKSPISFIAISPDGKTLATVESVSTGEVKLWDLNTGSAIRTLTYSKSKISAIAFSSDGKRIATGNTLYSVEIKSTNGDGPMLQFKGHHAPILSIAFSNDGNTIASSDISSGVILWNAITGSVKNVLKSPQGDCYSLFFSPNNKWLLMPGYDNRIAKWNITMGLDRWLDSFLGDRKSEIELWAMRSENENDMDYSKRVNETSRNAKNQKFIDQGKEWLMNYYRNVINWKSFTLGGYNTSTGTLTIGNNLFGDFEVAIPQNKVEGFTKTYPSFQIAPELTINNNEILPDKLILKSNTETYTATQVK
jgi:FOG: WD40 repeat